jgi:hypothetical protein
MMRGIATSSSAVSYLAPFIERKRTQEPTMAMATMVKS